MKTLLWPWGIVVFFVMANLLQGEENYHPFTVYDLLAMDRIPSAQVSPDGKCIVFTLRVTDLEENKGHTSLWIVNLDGTGLKRLTSHSANDWDPLWHPNGQTVYFLSTRSGSSQVWKISVDGGEAEQVTKLPLDVNHFLLSPDGKYLVVAMEVFPGTLPEETKKQLEEQENRKAKGRIYDRLFVRHWDIWMDGRRSHLFVLNSNGTGNPIDLMPEMDADCPSRPFGGREEFTFTPDSKGIVFTTKNAEREEAWSTNFDLYHVTFENPKPKCLTASNPAWDTMPIFSPDGKTLAYLAMARPGYEADRFRIVLKPWPEGKEKILTENWDRSVKEMIWSKDGGKIFATAEDIGQTSLFAIDVKSGKVERIWHKGTVQWPQIAKNRIVFGLDHFCSPVELYSIRMDGKDFRSITQINAKKLSKVKMGEPEQFSFPGWNDETVYGYIVTPVDFDPSKKYPVAFLIHGGPQGSFGNHFHYRWNPQVYAGRGYVAVMIDFHGSTGYGQAFTDAIRGDWGGKPLVDLQKGLEFVIKKYSWIDGERVGALGASFGGYMINWIAGNWPERFKCLVCHDGNLDEKMAYFDTDELWFPEWDHEGTPWTNPEGYEKHNPIRFADRWKTPMLVIQGAKDFRVVETQGLSTFTLLQRKGISSKLLYFPDENHWVLKPHNSILWHDTVLGWLDQWLKEKK